jgi:4-hydroxy-3-polyprenylbenzoate decarboxylase
VDVVLSEPAGRVLAVEHGLPADPRSWCPGASAADLGVHASGDIMAPPASGSRAPRAMLVVPCSMGTAARIASGVSSNLIERCADVVLKERRPLVLVPRETPLSSIHLRNLLTLSDAGAHIVPAMPGFYIQPRTIDDMVNHVAGKALDALGVEHDLYPRWRETREISRTS